jgi:1-acyl-sn-glycerol-3-phosphate acyltransferase
MSRCAESLAAGDNLIIFPEGTRSPPVGLRPFHRGFAHIATLARVDLQPVHIDCSPPTLLRGEAWHRIPERAPVFRIEVGDAVLIAPFLEGAARPLAARRLVSHFERWYSDHAIHG